MAGQVLIQRGAVGAGGGGGTPGGADTQVQFNDGGAFGGDAGLTFNKTTDALTIGGNATLLGEAANVLAQRNGTNGQMFRVYATYTDPSNYSRLGIGLDNGSFRLEVQNAGTGNIQNIVLSPANELQIQTPGGSPLTMSAGRIRATNGSTIFLQFSGHENELAFGATTKVSWGTSEAYNATRDLNIVRNGAGVLSINNASGGGVAVEGFEMTAPSAPAANGGRQFYRDNGSGKTQLCVIFNTGAVQVIATEP